MVFEHKSSKALSRIAPMRPTWCVLLVEAACPVQAQIMAGRAQVKPHMVPAVLAMVAASDDRADPAAVAPHAAQDGQ